MAGFLWEILKGKWVVPEDTRPSFAGRTVIVTGANVGLGFETSLKFVELGAKKVILAVRTLSKGEEAKKQIESRTGITGVADVWQLDMLDYSSVKTFADRATKELDRLDYAILNAGLAKMAYTPSQYGHEETLQVNVFSTALLALLLAPKIRASKTADFTPVMEIVSSGNHFIVTSLKSESEPVATYDQEKNFSGAMQYSISKLFDVYIQKTMAQLAMSKDTGKPDFYVTAVCPGATTSDLAREANSWWMKILLKIFNVVAQRKTEEGARTYISGVTQGEKAHGRFWKDDTIRQ